MLWFNTSGRASKMAAARPRRPCSRGSAPRPHPGVRRRMARCLGEGRRSPSARSSLATRGDDREPRPIWATADATPPARSGRAAGGDGCRRGRSAGAGAPLAVDHEGRGAVGPALVDVGAARLLAHRDEAEVAHRVLEPQIAGVGVNDERNQPGLRSAICNPSVTPACASALQPNGHAVPGAVTERGGPSAAPVPVESTSEPGAPVRSDRQRGRVAGFRWTRRSMRPGPWTGRTPTGRCVPEPPPGRRDGVAGARAPAEGRQVFGPVTPQPRRADRTTLVDLAVDRPSASSPRRFPHARPPDRPNSRRRGRRRRR